MLKPRNIFLFAVVTFAILFLAWGLSGYPTKITVCEVANGAEKCEQHYVPIGIIRWVLFQLDRYGVLLTAIFTGFIAWFTWTLRQSTEKMWVETKKAADAADLSARAMIGLELPIIRITPDNITTSDQIVGGEMIVSYGVAHVVFANFGRTRAIPIEIRYGMSYGDRLPEEPIYPASDGFLPDTSFEPPPPKPAPHSTPLRRLSNCSVVVPTGVIDLLKSKEMGLWFYCCLVYEDFIGDRREVARCWRWQYVGMGLDWRPDTTPAYNRKT